MKQPRDRIPAADEYLQDLGRATYNFAYLEWGIIWLTETIERGFLAKATKLTAGQIADRFWREASKIADSEADKSALLELAEVFKNLVEDRNRLIHGNPFTAGDGEQRLQYNGKHGRKDWTIALMQEFSDRVALASVEAGRLLHGGRYQAWRQVES
jgi:hypothetical protein